MPIEINNTPFEVDGSKCIFQLGKPEVNVNGMIIRVFNSGSTTENYTYTDTTLESTTVSVPASGSVGNPLYVLAASSSASDFFNLTTNIASIRLLITGSSLGNAFTEELITATGAGSWTKPVGVTEVIVECWGGGGAGGGATVSPSGGGGGGAGQYSRKLIRYTSPQVSIPYSIGLGGTGGTGTGNSGGDTTWNTTDVVAKGGGGGDPNGTTLGANGGVSDVVGSIGDVIHKSTDGSIGILNRIGEPIGGAGADGAGSVGISYLPPLGTGYQEYGGDGGIDSFNVSQNGNPGSNYASGGGGATKLSGPNRSGGNGAQGLIRLIYR